MKEKERLWRTSKYEVLSHSEAIYREIQSNVNHQELVWVTARIQEAKKKCPTIGTVTNAYEHMWGYFKKKATDQEREETFHLLRQYQTGAIEVDHLWRHIATLAINYDVTYIQESTLIAPYVKEEYQ